MKKQIILALALVAIMLPMASASDNREVYFTDLEVENPQYNQIQWLARSGILQGYPDGTFRSGTCINRAEFLKVLYLTTQSELDPSGTNPFPDVDASQWYYPYVMTAYNDGVVSGYEDGTFGPANCVTKPEVLKMASEAYYSDEEINEDLNVGGFPIEISQSDWFFNYYNFAIPRNLAVFDVEFTFNQPIASQGATRGDVAETLWRFEALQTADALVYDSSTTSPREIFQEYTGIDEMLTFYFPVQWYVEDEFFYETAAGETSEMATITLQHQMMPSDQISINERMVMCGDTADTATCLETEIGYTISSFNPSPATLKTMEKIQSTLTYESPEFGLSSNLVLSSGGDLYETPFYSFIVPEGLTIYSEYDGDSRDVIMFAESGSMSGLNLLDEGPFFCDNPYLPNCLVINDDFSLLYSDDQLSQALELKGSFNQKASLQFFNWQEYDATFRIPSGYLQDSSENRGPDSLLFTNGDSRITINYESLLDGVDMPLALIDELSDHIEISRIKTTYDEDLRYFNLDYEAVPSGDFFSTVIMEQRNGVFQIFYDTDKYDDARVIVNSLATR